MSNILVKMLSDSFSPSEALLIKKNKELEEAIQHYSQEVSRLHQIIKMMKKDIYGKKSEKLIENPNDQLSLFDEIEQEDAKDKSSVESASSEETETEQITYNRKKPGRAAKTPFPENLPREVVIIDIEESQKVCPHDGQKLEVIGEEVTEKLKIIPRQLIVVVEKKLKYGCTCKNHIVAAKSNSILPGTIATVELIAYLIYSKFGLGLPLYRLEEGFNHQNIVLSRSTMARWLIQVSELLQPIWNILEEMALATNYIGIDATHVQVLKEDGRSASSKSFMWARGSPEKGIVLFDYDVSGGGLVAENLLLGYQGAMQSDAHKGYSRLNEKVHRLGCMMHARRKFFEAFESSNKKSKLAKEALNIIKKIYKCEEKYKKEALSNSKRQEQRLIDVKPLIEQLGQLCTDNIRSLIPSSPLYKAVKYYLDEKPRLINFLNDGRYEIDNGWIERMIRKFAIGRNNWMCVPRWRCAMVN